eukprot:TRINITY_DN5156_c0_g1_i1.p1 TRINITY_DN5156_c0_g1~~TRINITY_DN5156_c0_g1_i1.p1  ORF type:complete len:763 (+),score=-115.85 TRINITY_DN5156_c0_g1_i1:583-2871(+)
MSRALVVVESPAKAKTIKKYLSSEYTVLASYGHVRDLIPKGGAVEVTKDFSMHYEPIARNVKHIEKIEQALSRCDQLILAPDPDREGEAIAWHIMVLLKERGTLREQSVSRVVFHEITRSAIQKAIKETRPISMPLVNAQQTRRALDYLVGFTLSPLLWKKIRTGLSAGRVQSPALRMIAEREKEIMSFEKKEYWTLHANVSKSSRSLSATLVQYAGEKVEQFSFLEEAQAEKVKQHLLTEAGGVLEVTDVRKSKRKRKPPAPFITSTLQQEAANKLGFSAQRTMQVAQQLYEGVDIGSGQEGLITYMRTDSVNLAKEAIEHIRSHILSHYGTEYLAQTPRVYKTKTKNAQEAHEAIRPTDIVRTPESLQNVLSKDQAKLYSLIWRRSLASQMIEASLDGLRIEMGSANSVFSATGSVITHLGFMIVYKESEQESSSVSEEAKIENFPPVTVGEKLVLEEIGCKQHFTEPPPRYSEASLVKALEEHGIGRPSTYATIIATLKQREYVTLENKRFKASDVAMVVNKFLTGYFCQYVDYAFTAHLEDALDSIARGDTAFLPVLNEFWFPFKEAVDQAEEKVQRSDITQEKIDENCPECAAPLSIRLGKRGQFIGCTRYPECRYTRNKLGEGADEESTQLEDRACPKCTKPLVIKAGRYGKFIGCSGYPDCKHIEPIALPKDTAVTCPVCEKNSIVERKSRRGKVFFSCQGYPECKYAIWQPPLAEKCPLCHWPILMLKETRRYGKQKICPQDTCDFKENIAEES